MSARGQPALLDPKDPLALPAPWAQLDLQARLVPKAPLARKDPREIQVLLVQWGQPA
jgi:hypothetical protein